MKHLTKYYDGKGSVNALSFCFKKYAILYIAPVFVRKIKKNAKKINPISRRKSRQQTYNYRKI